MSTYMMEAVKGEGMEGSIDGQTDQTLNVNKKWYQGGDVTIRGFYNPREIADWHKMRHPEYFKNGRVGGIRLLKREGERAEGGLSSDPHGQQSALQRNSDSMGGKALSTQEDNSSATTNGQTGRSAIVDQATQTELEDGAFNRRLDRREGSVLPPSAERRGRPLKNAHGTKSVQCDFCPKRFSTSASRSVHVQSIHQGRQWYCKYCHRGFAAPAGQNMHMKKCSFKPSESQSSISCGAGSAVKIEEGAVP